MKDFEYSTHDKDGKFIKVHTVEDCVKSILTRHERNVNQIARLEEEIKRLKSETYKDEELQKASEKVRKIEEDYYRGFPISNEENLKIEEWKNEHDSFVHSLLNINSKLQAGGCIGGRYSYEFLPTSIGTIGCIKCSKCGERFTFREL